MTAAELKAGDILRFKEGDIEVAHLDERNGVVLVELVDGDILAYGREHEFGPNAMRAR